MRAVSKSIFIGNTAGGAAHSCAAWLGPHTKYWFLRTTPASGEPFHCCALFSTTPGCSSRNVGDVASPFSLLRIVAPSLSRKAPPQPTKGKRFFTPPATPGALQLTPARFSPVPAAAGGSGAENPAPPADPEQHDARLQRVHPRQPQHAGPADPAPARLEPLRQLSGEIGRLAGELTPRHRLCLRKQKIQACRGLHERSPVRGQKQARNGKARSLRCVFFVSVRCDVKGFGPFSDSVVLILLHLIASIHMYGVYLLLKAHLFSKCEVSYAAFSERVTHEAPPPRAPLASGRFCVLMPYLACRWELCSSTPAIGRRSGWVTGP